MKVDNVQPDPDKPETLVDQLYKITQVLDGLVEFGDPIDPFDPANTLRAGSTAGAPPGTTSNIHGSWVEIVLETTGRITKTCTHNLYLEEDNSTYSLPVAGEPNVRWLMFGWMHDGDLDSSATLDLSVAFIGGTVATNSLQLEFQVTKGGTLTIDSNHPIICTLFFTRASRM